MRKILGTLLAIILLVGTQMGTSVSASESADWRNLYADKIMEYIEQYNVSRGEGLDAGILCQLMDADLDGIPELIIGQAGSAQGGTYSLSMDVFYISNGIVQQGTNAAYIPAIGLWGQDSFGIYLSGEYYRERNYRVLLKSKLTGEIFLASHNVINEGVVDSGVIIDRLSFSDGVLNMVRIAEYEIPELLLKPPYYEPDQDEAALYCQKFSQDFLSEYEILSNTPTIEFLVGTLLDDNGNRYFPDVVEKTMVLIVLSEYQPYMMPLTAVPTSSAVLVDGKQIDFDAYNIDDNNYFKLRDLAYVLNGSKKQFAVEWSEGLNVISLVSSQPYTAVGGELVGKGKGTKNPVPTNSEIMLDDQVVVFTAYNLEGNNYFKLRDIGKALDFAVEWDEAKNMIVIDTSKGYVE